MNLPLFLELLWSWFNDGNIFMHETLDLRHRSYKKELLDNDAVPFEDIRINMRELNTINTWLGGHAITIAGFKNLIGRALLDPCMRNWLR